MSTFSTLGHTPHGLMGRVTLVPALRNISLLEKFEAKFSFSTRNFFYLFFFRWFYLNLGSLVPVFFVFLIPFVLRNQVISSFSLLHFMFPICFCMCFLSSSCCSHGHIPVVFFCVMSSKPYPGGFFCVMSSKYYRQIQYSFPFFFVVSNIPLTWPIFNFFVFFRKKLYSRLKQNLYMRVPWSAIFR